jgi:hypothetical protein
MKPKILLRIAAVFMFLHTIGHTMGALTWKTPPSAAVGAVISGMENNHFNFMGRQASLALFFDGYGAITLLVLLLMVALLWLLSNQAQNPLASPVLVALSVFLLLMAVAEYICFFPLAAVVTFLAGVCAVYARVRISQNKV